MTKLLVDPGEGQQVQLPEGVKLCSILESGMWKFDYRTKPGYLLFTALVSSSRKHPLLGVCVSVSLRSPEAPQIP